MKKIILAVSLFLFVFAATLAHALTVQLTPGEYRTCLNRPTFGHLTLSNVDQAEATVFLDYGDSADAPASHPITIDAASTRIITPAAWPVTVSNNTSNALFVVGF